MSILKANRIENLTTTDGGINVNNSGNVGVGTDSPARRFVVSGGSSEAVAQFTNNTSGNGADDGFQILHFTDGLTRLLNRENGAIAFSTNNTERLRIDSSGNVGIGNSSPSNYSSTGRNLVVGTGSSAAGLTVASGATNTGNIYFAAGSTGDDQVRGQIRYNHSTEAMDLYTDASLRMRIDSSGRLLVGTSSAIQTSTNSVLQLKHADGAQIILARDNSAIAVNQDIGTIRFYGNDGGSYQECARIAAEADGSHANNDKPTALRFYTTGDGASSPGERMRINSSGRVGINETSPDAPLHIRDSRDEGNGSTYPIIQFSRRNGGSNDAILHAVHDGSDGIKALRLDLLGSERLRFTNNGLTFNGDTAAANALSDYEEGTWTPTLIGDTGIASHNAQIGTYTKIGRLVHCRCRIDLSSKNTLSGNLSIGGLPFTVANVDAGTSLDFGGVFNYFINASSTVYFISVNPNGGATTATLYFKSSSSSGMNALNKLDIDSDFDFRATFTYYV